jgi:hypothetical protein
MDDRVRIEFGSYSAFQLGSKITSGSSSKESFGSGGMPNGPLFDNNEASHDKAKHMHANIVD